MSGSPYSENTLLRTALARVLRDSGRANSNRRVPSDVTIVLTMNEVNDRHGTGPLVKRIMRGRRGVLSIRSRDDWGGQDFGDEHFRLSHQGLTRPESFDRVISFIGDREVRSVLCVPYLEDEVTTALVIHEVFGVPVCGYIMDDQNVATKGISDTLMREFLEKCSVRFATHPELCDAYQRKYGLSFHVLPAVVPHELVASEPVEYVPPAGGRRLALLGSIWDQVWFDRLCDVLADCGAMVDWFGNNKSPWLKFPPEQLRRAGIVARGVIPESQLAEELRDYPLVIVPMSMLDKMDSNRGVAAFSLPGRILFAAAAGQTPSLILGSPETCGSRFVRHFGIGETAPYHPARVKEAIENLCDAGEQKRYRANAARIGSLFSDRGIPEWLQESIEKGEPADSRFEDAFWAYRQQAAPLKTLE